MLQDSSLNTTPPDMMVVSTEHRSTTDPAPSPEWNRCRIRGLKSCLIWTICRNDRTDPGISWAGRFDWQRKLAFVRRRPPFLLLPLTRPPSRRPTCNARATHALGFPTTFPAILTTSTQHASPHLRRAGFLDDSGSLWLLEAWGPCCLQDTRYLQCARFLPSLTCSLSSSQRFALLSFWYSVCSTSLYLCSPPSHLAYSLPSYPIHV